MKMSDVSKTSELIAEARKFLFSDSEYGYEDTFEGDLICRLADALEAATHEQDTEGDIRRAVRLWSERFIPGDRWDTEDACDLDAALKCVVEANPDRSRARVPVQGEPNGDREALRKEFEYRIRTAVTYGSGLGYRERPVQERADWIQREIRNAVGHMARATAPDAAKTIAELKDYSMRTVEHGLKVIDQRDAALAAVERVREIHKPKSTGRTEYVLDGRGGITGTAPTFTCPEGCMASAWFFEGQECDTYKALDGAPEPEWEGR